MTKLLFAETFQDLLRSLRSLDSAVPRHPKDRNNSQVEQYTLVSFLSSMPWSAASFPLTVHKREKPDFLVTLGSRTLGIEHTEGTSQNLAKERAVRADGIGPSVHFIKPASIGDEPKSRREIEQEVRADAMGPGWIGDAVEQSWVEAMTHFVSRKLATAAKPGYMLYERNALLIYDNWPAPALKHAVAVPRIHEKLVRLEAWKTFWRIYILDEQTLVELSDTDAIYHHVWRTAI